MMCCFYVWEQVLLEFESNEVLIEYCLLNEEVKLLMILYENGVFFVIFRFKLVGKNMIYNDVLYK